MASHMAKPSAMFSRRASNPSWRSANAASSGSTTVVRLVSDRGAAPPPRRKSGPAPDSGALAGARRTGADATGLDTVVSDPALTTGRSLDHVANDVQSSGGRTPIFERYGS